MRGFALYAVLALLAGLLAVGGYAYVANEKITTDIDTDTETLSNASSTPTESTSSKQRPEIQDERIREILGIDPPASMVGRTVTFVKQEGGYIIVKETNTESSAKAQSGLLVVSSDGTLYDFGAAGSMDRDTNTLNMTIFAKCLPSGKYYVADIGRSEDNEEVRNIDDVVGTIAKSAVFEYQNVDIGCISNGQRGGESVSEFPELVVYDLGFFAEHGYIFGAINAEDEATIKIKISNATGGVAYEGSAAGGHGDSVRGYLWFQALGKKLSEGSYVAEISSGKTFKKESFTIRPRTNVLCSFERTLGKSDGLQDFQQTVSWSAVGAQEVHLTPIANTLKSWPTEALPATGSTVITSRSLTLFTLKAKTANGEVNCIDENGFPFSPSY